MLAYLRSWGTLPRELRRLTVAYHVLAVEVAEIARQQREVLDFARIIIEKQQAAAEAISHNDEGLQLSTELLGNIKTELAALAESDRTNADLSRASAKALGVALVKFVETNKHLLSLILDKQADLELSVPHNDEPGRMQ